MLVFYLLSLAYSLEFDCEFTLPDGKEVDLSGLYMEIPDYSYNTDKYTYYLNICGNVSKTCEGDLFAIATQFKPGRGCVAVLGRDIPTSPTLNYLDSSKPNAGFVLEYGNGDRCNNEHERKVVINLHCSKGKTELREVDEPHKCRYEFEVYSKEACLEEVLEEGVKGSSIWKVALVCIALVLVFFYIVHKCKEKAETDPSLVSKIPCADGLIGCMDDLFARARFLMTSNKSGMQAI